MNWEDIDKLTLPEQIDPETLLVVNPPTREHIDAFEKYKEELKKENLKNRLNTLQDIRLSMMKINDLTPNAEIFKRNIVQELDNDKVILLEQKYSEAMVDIDTEKTKEINRRQKKLDAKEYLKNIVIADITTIASLKQVVKNLIDLVNDD